jgi:hypothetical protein
LYRRLRFSILFKDEAAFSFDDFVDESRLSDKVGFEEDGLVTLLGVNFSSSSP